MQPLTVSQHKMESIKAVPRGSSSTPAHSDGASSHADHTQVLQLSSLEILDVSKNKIASIPEEIRNMTSLKFLAVAKNRITRLPLALGDMPSLSKLKFDENPVEFPPPDAYRPLKERAGPAGESEKEKDVCLQVKRYLRQCSTREKLRTESESDVRCVAVM